MWRFLAGARTGGQTDPVPALKRAFEVLGRSGRGRAKIICLLTDGVFPDNDNVLRVIAQCNRGGSVQIFTYLAGRRAPEAEKVMKQLAERSRGRYNYISLDG